MEHYFMKYYVAIKNEADVKRVPELINEKKKVVILLFSMIPFMLYLCVCMCV